MRIKSFSKRTPAVLAALVILCLLLLACSPAPQPMPTLTLTATQVPLTPTRSTNTLTPTSTTVPAVTAAPTATSLPPTATSTPVPPMPTPTLTPTPTPIPFYKLRLHITTTSDWSWVRLIGGAKVAASGIVEAKGEFPRKGGNGAVGLNQTIGAALRKEEALSLTIDFALMDIGDLVKFEITRGDLGETIVEVWNANGATLTKVKTIHWSGKDPPSNSFLFTVEADAITSGGPLNYGLEEIADAEFSISRSLDSQLPELQPQFYRARINFTTTSDWASLSIIRGAEIFGVRLLDAMGNPTRAEMNRIEFALNQPQEQANAGLRVGLTAEVILGNVMHNGIIEFVISKGHLNDATVEVFNYNTATTVSVKQVTHSGIATLEDPRNPLTFSVDAAALIANGPLKVQKPTVDKMIWAFYYPWYHTNDWTSPFLKDRPAMRYASSDSNALARHIEQAKSVGIDGFIASWWGPGDYTDRNFKLLLDAATARDFAVTAYFETLKATGRPRDEKQITRWLEYLLRKHGQHPAYYHLGGSPVVVIWASNAVPLPIWRRTFTRLHKKGLDAVYIAMGHNPESLSVFDGSHEYNVAGQYRLGAFYQHAVKQVRSYSLLYPNSRPKIWIATLQPGYDERTLPDREGFYWDRRNGDSYRYTFEAAMKSDPDWLFITSWNEWWEHTYIEPSIQYGDFYLRLTKEFAEMWKGEMTLQDDQKPGAKS